eukprot:scaffold22132_cov119-Isochrysis_galbana.AAC.2
MSSRRGIRFGVSASASFSESLSGAPRACGTSEYDQRRAKGEQGRAGSQRDIERGAAPLYHSLEPLGQSILGGPGCKDGLGEVGEVKQDLHAFITRREEGRNVQAHRGPHAKGHQMSVEEGAFRCLATAKVYASKGGTSLRLARLTSLCDGRCCTHPEGPHRPGSCPSSAAALQHRRR